MIRTWKSIPFALAGALALSACAGDATRSEVAYDDDDTRASASVARPAPETAATTPKRAPAAPATADTAPAPLAGDDELVGIEACDDYLETYRSCHRVLGMYPADSIDSRFESLRSNWVARAIDPATHESLAQQCESLTDDMEAALDGRDCPEDDIDEDVIAGSSLEDAIDDDEPDRP